MTPLPSAAPFVAGLDLGQSRDFSALALLERTLHTGPRDPVTWTLPAAEFYVLRRLHRFPLGTPYPQVVDALAHLFAAPPLARRATLVVDATGIGAPVVDYLRRTRLPVTLQPVCITAGQAASLGPGRLSVPRKDLIAALHLLLEQGRLLVPESLSLGRTLARELKNFSRRAGLHDDLVLALSLAAWSSLRRWPFRAARYNQSISDPRRNTRS
ncbi:MAG: hypothetical protein IPM24_17845 [Bryobacterales bacterium]|nr:hypothetical protein [Bryobacterales bacterium]